jgi:hypothetical protein
MFFDKKCTISSVVYSKVRWSEIKTETTLYSLVECNFEPTSKVLTDTNLWRETDNNSYKVTLPVLYNQVRKWQTIELFENILWSIGTFVIENILVNQSISGYIDNFYLTVTRRNDS